MMNPITDFENFLKLSIHCGTIIRTEEFKKAMKPAIKIWVDFGEIGIKKSSAQITKHYKAEDLIGIQVLGLINIPPRNIAGFISEFLLLGLEHEDGGIVLVRPEKIVPNGNILK